MNYDTLPAATVYVLGESVVRLDVGKHTLSGLPMTNVQCDVGGELDSVKYVTVTFAVDAVNVVHVRPRGDFADKLLNVRKSKGVTQAQLAKSLGVSDMAVRTWENGSRSPRTGDLPRIAKVLGVRVYDLMPDDLDEE